MSTIATAYVQVLPSTKGMKSELTGELSGVGTEAGNNIGNNITSSLTSKFKNVGTFVAVGAAIGAAIAKGAAAAVKEGAGLEQAIGGVETLFKDSSKEVFKNAQNAYKTSGLSAKEYMQNVTGFSASLLQSLGGDTNKAAKVADMAMIDMSDNANKMGTDMGAIQNAYQGFAKQNYTMLDNLKLGYGGTKQEMQRLLQDAQKFSGVKYDISNLSDVYSAIHAVQEELGITGTTAEEAASTISGSFSAVRASLSNVLGGLSGQIDLGQALEGLGSSFSTFFNDNLVPMLSDVFKNFPDLIAGLFNDGFSTGISDATGSIVGLIATLAMSIIETLGSLLILAPVIGLSVVKGVIEAIPDAVAAITEMCQEMAEQLPQMAGYFAKAMPELIMGIITGLIKAIPSILSASAQIGIAIIQGISEAIYQGIQTLPETFATIGEFLSGIGQSISVSFGSAFQSLGEVIAPAVDKIKGTFGGIATSAANAVNAMLGTFSAVANLISAVMAPVVGKVKSIFTQAAAAMKSAFSGIEGFFTSLANRIAGAVGTAVAKFREIGQRIVENIKAGFEGAWDKLVSSVREKLDKLANMFNGITEKVNNVTDKINSKTQSTTNSAQKLSNSVQSVQAHAVNSGVRAYSVGASIQSYQAAPQQINVILSGSAKNVFDSVRVENNKMVTATGYKALA